MTADPIAFRAVATLLDPQRGLQDVSIAGREEAVLAICTANKIPLLSLPDWGKGYTALVGHPAFCRAREAEAEQWRAQRREYLPLHEALSSAGVANVLIKSVGIPPSLPYRSDNLDLLVDVEDGPTARQILFDLGYVELINVEEPQKFLFRKFHLGESISAVHLHQFVGWGTEFLAAADVLRSAQPSADDPAVFLPGPENALLITMAHAFYEDKAIKLGDLWKAIHLLRTADLDWEGMYRLVEARGWRAGLDTCILLWARLEEGLYGDHSFPPGVVKEAEAHAPVWCREYVRARLAEREGAGRPYFSFPWPVSFFFSKRHYYAKVLCDSALRPRQKMADIFRHSWAGVKRRLPLPFQRGMLVTLSGIDGSGKTTQAELLRRAFRVCDIRTRYVWSRAGSSRFTDGVIRLVRRLTLGGALPKGEGLDLDSDTRAAKVARKRFWLRHPLWRAGWVALVGLDLLPRYWVCVGWPLLRRQVVIGDRYVYDAMVELAALADAPGFLESRAARWFLRLCPRPGAAYLLHLDPERAATRDPQEVVAFLKQQVCLYRQGAAKWGLRVIDADRDLADVADELVRDGLRAYYRGWARPTSAQQGR
ncbi:MAG: nucleotidyltransferase family protein [Chloroflexi bacterium]|nr:nucleotidyltransferase family protein [Chloroflexota bacterium]